MPTRLLTLLTAAVLCSASGHADEPQPPPGETLHARLTWVEQRIDEAPDDTHLQIERAKLTHLLAMRGDEDALERSQKLLAKLHESHPDDPGVRAYYGSSRLHAASRLSGFKLAKKGEWTKQGLSLLDEAVEAEPEDVGIRFIRAASTRHLPEWMERRAQSSADVAWLAQRIDEAVADGGVPAFIGAAVHLYHGQNFAAEDQRDKARAAWRAAVDLAPESHAGREAQRLLDDDDQ